TELQALNEWPNWVASSCSASSQSSSGITVDDASARQIAIQASSGNTNVGYSLYDSTGNQLASYNDTFNTYSASIDKSMLLVAYLNQVGSGSLSDNVKTNLTAMIEQSVDPAANY